MTPVKSNDCFPILCKAAGLPVPEGEVRFHPTRKWRFDWGWEPWRVALEIDGGAFRGGRHTRGAGFVRDCEKINEAQLLGWMVLRVTPQQINDGTAFTLLERAFAVRKS
jgi:very-short-patch-repair endonuclease